MPKEIVTSSMDKYFDLDHIIRSEKPNGNNVTTDIALRTFFGRVAKGQSDIFTAPFAKGVPTSKLLSEWNETLKSIAAKWPTLYEYEMDLAAKVGPLSIALPMKKRMKDVLDYYSGIHLPGRQLEPWAAWDVIHEFQRAHGIRMKSESATIEDMKLSTNSGAPFFDKRRRVLEETGTNIGVCPVGYTLQMKLADYQFDCVATIGWRGQEGGIKVDDVKQRVVWMFPFSLNIMELSVYQPIIKAAQTCDLVPAWISNEKVDERITKLFDTKGDNDLVVCTDFTKFDQHFNLHLQQAAEEVIDDLLVGKGKEMWMRTIFPVKYIIPMMYDYGRIITGHHGMASGSGGTNVDETLAHRALQYEVAGLHNATLNPNSMCLGDDGVLSYPGITAKDVTESYSHHGLEMNISKQYESLNDCIYLRRWHHKDYRIQDICVGVYSTMRALGRLRYLERWMNPDVWNEKSVALRQLSILENIKYHPLREEFVNFCMKRDKFRLGKDIPGFFENLPEIAQEHVELMPGFLGYVKSLQMSEQQVAKGIDQWWIVNYLKSV